MNDQTLLLEIRRVGVRIRRQRIWTLRAICLMLLAVALVLSHSAVVSFVLVVIALPLMVFTGWCITRNLQDPLRIARRIEERFADLDARLLAALEQRPGAESNSLGFLQEIVVGETLEHARSHGWDGLVSSSALRTARLAQWAAFACFLIALAATVHQVVNNHRLKGWQISPVASAAYQLTVEPGNTSIERGSGLLVLARFNGKLPGDAQLLSREADGQMHRLAMSRSLNDPVFAARMRSLKSDLSYAVRYGEAQSEWFKASVFDLPDLKQADAHLKFPSYTALPDKDEKDIRSVTVVEGTKVNIIFHLNKPIAQASLLPTAAPVTQPAAQPSNAPIKLVADPNDPSAYSVSMDLKQSQRFHLQLVDADGRANRQPPELAINVNPNKPAELKPILPGHDIDVSPLQEVSLREQVSDDFGVHRAGLTYSVAGQPPTEVVLAENVPAKRPLEIADVLPLEKFNAEPDQLVSYYFWAEDFAADGSIRRTSGDMFFAEVRPFEEIFRQGQQPTSGEQQQSQESNQNSQNGQQAEQVAEQQKEIIAATWKIIRRETTTTLSAQYVPDVNLVAQSQATVRAQAAAMQDRLTDPRSLAFLTDVLRFMDSAATQLKKAAGTTTLAPLSIALSSEQSAYQELLKLRAREFEVIRGNRQQQGSQSASSALSRRQQQLDQLPLEQEQNRYQTQNAATPQDNPQQRETRQVLSRLKELAQRQEDLNRQMRELQSALQRAQDDAQKEDLQRQLARLRDQQQQQLRDTDELRDRMAQPENQQRMADSRQQLEQTREDVRRASESLDKAQVPEAAAAAARASEQLNNLQNDFRRSAAGQSAEAMTQMRDAARQLDENQKQLSQKLSQLDNTNQRSLREGDDRKQISQQLAQQKAQLDQLLNTMRKTSEEAETSEPLLSRQLYDSLRKASEQQTAEALDAGRQLLDKGFAGESAQAEAEAGKGIAQLRQDVEKAAGTVLGDETESLRKAKSQLAQLSDSLQREIDRNRPAGQAGSAPGTQAASGRNQITRGGATTRGSDPRADGRTATTQRSGALATGRQQNAGGQPRTGQAANQGQSAQAQNQQGTQQSNQPGNQPGLPQDSAQQQASNGGAGPGQSGAPQQGTPQQGADQQANSAAQRSARGPGLRGNVQNGGQSLSNGGDPQQAANSGQPPQQGQPGGQAQRNPAAQSNPPRDQPADRVARANGGPGGNEQNQQAANQQDNVGGGNPLTGDNFTAWSDRLRDVEQMVNDPRLQAQAATIRDRARDVRGEFKRHATPPNWDMVNDQIGQPLAELRDAVAQELARKESSDALVPLDREAVPPQYAEQERRYYERLGSGR